MTNDNNNGEETYFAKISNEILNTAERVVNVVDEGVSILMNSGAEQQQKQQQGQEGGSGDASASSSSSHDNNEGAGEFGIYDNEEEQIIMEGGEDLFDQGSPLQGMADGVLRDIMSSQSHSKPQTIMEHIDAFRSAINWTEPLIISLIIFQIIMFVICLYIAQPNRSAAIRISYMVIVGLLVRSSQYVNEYCSNNWNTIFSEESTFKITQNYFDKNGIFIGIFFVAPLLLNCFIMLFMFLREASTLLVDVKRAELKRKYKNTKQQQQQQQQDNSTNNSSNNKKSNKKKAQQEKKNK